MVQRFRFDNYKLLRSVQIELGRLNVIVGRNAVGKSSVLEGLHSLSQLLFQSDLERVFGGAEALEELFSRPDSTAFKLEAEMANEVRFGMEARKGSDLTEFWLAMGPTVEREEVSWFMADPESPILNANGPVAMGRVVSFRFDARALSAESYSEDEAPSLEQDGAGLASTLQYLQGLRNGSMEEIESDLAMVVPGARRIRALPARVHRTEQLRITVDGTETVSERRREVTGARFEVEFDGQGWIRSGQLSEGTVLALGVITAMRSNQADVVLLDDIDKGLHPVAQRELIGLLRRILETNTTMQVVATSHSPFVLDALEPDEVLVAGPVSPAESRIRRLVDHPAWLSRSKYMRPGEFWSFVGEGWVAEG